MTKPRLPQIGEFVRQRGKLISIEEIPPEPQKPQLDYIFEDVEAKCELRFDGEVVQELNTFTDFYGEGTAVKHAIAEMKVYARQKMIDETTRLEVVVVKVATRCRMRQTTGKNFYDKNFYDFKPLEYGCFYNLPDPVETVIWSSKRQIDNE